ncbi:MAG: hypothetical protein F6K11_00805 [Leptolyngbya sp. SIO3F4]|nr:hypothetical protein [Leptolyngbya sp. SIO3F4]
MPVDKTDGLSAEESGGLEIPLRYFYAEPADWEKYQAACTHLMWLKSTFLSQLCNSFISVNWEYYAECAELDAQARGLSTQEFFTECCNWDGKLTEYQKRRPTFKPSPLATVPDVDASQENRRRVKTIRTGRANGALLRVACEVDRCNLITVTSRVLRWHFDRYWEKLYVPQIQAAQEQSFRRVFNQE